MCVSYRIVSCRVVSHLLPRPRCSRRRVSSGVFSRLAVVVTSLPISLLFFFFFGRVLSQHHSLKNKANEWEISRGGGTKNGSS
jgi:hypothetical protein